MLLLLCFIIIIIIFVSSRPDESEITAQFAEICLFYSSFSLTCNDIASLQDELSCLTGKVCLFKMKLVQGHELNFAAIAHFGKYHNTLCLSPQILHEHCFCISIVSSFSWDLQWSQEKLETMLMQNLGGQIKIIMVFSKLAYV